MLGSQTQTPPKDNARLQSSQQTKARYFLAWRWHFYAGLFVVPFMIMLSLTGLVMLFDDEIEQLRYQDALSVAPLEQAALPASQQIAAVKSAYPLAAVTQFISSKQPDIANRVSIRFEDGKTLFIAVNPYTAQVQGEIDRSESWYELANNIHGTLLIGKSGDFLIEIAASLSILLLVTGIYMWLPTDNASRAGFLKLRVFSGSRVLLRDIHANLGGVLSAVLLLFVLSGLSWAGVWGAKMVQGWNTFPTYYTWGEKPQSNLTHASLNHGSEEELPWNLEHSTLPQSQTQDHSGHHGAEAVSMTSHATVSIDQIIEQAKALGFTQFKVFMPKSETGVYTVAANSMGGDVVDPRQDRTTHFDQYSGEVLVDVTWDDYTLMAKLMAAGVSLHQGDVSVVNKALNALFCLAFIAISITGVVMWWKRRPNEAGFRLCAPNAPTHLPHWHKAMILMLVLSMAFPLVGLTLIAKVN